MMKKLFLATFAYLICSQGNLLAHCQMPCGIYHDEMVFDQIDQYVETMYKGITVMNESKFATVKDKNEFIRWVVQKEKESNDTANLITQYFLQQKIKPGEEDTAKRLASAHKLLFLLVEIKQNPDIKIVETFNNEWEKFKLMFHREKYECAVDKMKFEKEQAELKEQEKHDHAHDHDHDHGHNHDHHPSKNTVNKK